MKKVQIIGGTYGHRENNRIVPKTSASGPFELEEAAAKRLVALGVAEYVTGAAAAGNTTQGNTVADPAPLEDMKLAELHEFALSIGMDEKSVKGLKSKAAARAAIAAYQNGGDQDDKEPDPDDTNGTNGEGDEEIPPELTPQAPA